MSLNIKTADGYQPLASLGGNVINGAEMQHYSEEERIIGYWTNGKPLYRRIISGTLPNSNTPVTIPLDIPNAENAHLVYGYITNKGNNYNFPLNYWRASSDSAMFVVADDGTSIVLNVFGSGIYNSKYYAEIRYTKTTDQPITNNNTYSTDEVLTGETWIDGKPIYRKVSRITKTTSTPYNQWSAIENYTDNGFSWLSNVDTNINMYMIYLNNSAANYVPYLALSVDKNLKLLNCFNTRNTNGLQVDTDFYVVAEYTKTTD